MFDNMKIGKLAQTGDPVGLPSRLYNSSGVPDLSSMPDKAEDLVIIRDAINWKQNTSIM